MIPLCTTATRPPPAEVGVRVHVGGCAVGRPSGVADAGGAPAAGSRPAPCRGWPASRRACRRRCARRARAPLQPSRSRGTPAGAAPRRRRSRPTSVRRTPRFRTWRASLRTMSGMASAPLDRPGAPCDRDSSPYVELDRDAWAALGAATEQPLTEAEVERVRGLGDELDLDEVEQVYLPLSRLLSLYVESAGDLHRAQESFLDQPQPPRTPFVIGVAGSVAVGKSTTAASSSRCSRTGRSTPRSRWSPPTASSTPTPSSSAGGSCTARGSPSPTTARRCCGSSSTSSPARTRSSLRRTPTSSTTSPRTTRWSCRGPTSSSSRGSTCCSPRGPVTTAGWGWR